MPGGRRAVARVPYLARSPVDSRMSCCYAPVWMTEFARVLTAALLTSLLVCPLRSQSGVPLPQLSSTASDIRARVSALPIGSKLTVNINDGNQYCGQLYGIEGETFSLREVDLKTLVTVRYEDVKRVRKDYGRPGFGGRRVYPRTNRIAAIAILGGLMALIFALVLSDKS